MKLWNKYTLPVIATGLLACCGTALAEVAVIANPAFAADAATSDEVKRLFLGKASQVGGSSATPVDQTSGSSAWAHFYDAVVGKNESQLRAYWSKLVFTGKGKPPAEAGADADVVAAVAADPSLIGYVDASAVTGDVKVLLMVP